MTPLLSASSRLCQGIYTAQADRWSTSALEERGRGLSHATPSLNHCHPERSAEERSDGARVEGPRFPQHHHDYVREFTPHKLIYGPPRRRKREAAASAKPRPSLIIVILSEVRRSVATEREWKDLLSSAPTRLRQGILTAAH